MEAVSSAKSSAPRPNGDSGRSNRQEGAGCLNVSQRGARGVAKAELSGEADTENYPGGSLRDDMYYIGLDVHKRTISYCVEDAAGHVHQEGKIGSTRRELDAWIKTLPNPGRSPWKRRSSPGGSTIQLLPHAERAVRC